MPLHRDYLRTRRFKAIAWFLFTLLIVLTVIVYVVNRML